MQIHIFTGAKGGVGKTLLALAATDYYSNNEVPCVVLEANTTNADISRILAVDGSAPRYLRQHESDTAEVVYTRFQSDIIVLRPENPFAVSNARGFWTRILRVARNLTEISRNSVLVVDTSLHIAGLYPDERDLSSVQIILKELYNTHNVTQVFIWHCWTLTAMKTAGIQGSYREAISNVLTGFYQPADDKGTDSDKNEVSITSPKDMPSIEMLHVFNIYALVPTPTNAQDFFLKLLRRASGHIETGITVAGAFSEMAGSPVGRAIQLNRLLDMFKQSLQNASPAELENFEIYEAVLRQIALDTREGNIIRRPRNVFPIPKFTYAAVNYVDKLVLSGSIGTSLEQVTKPIIDLLDYTHEYLRHLT
ncbi:MAG: hypothetical protein KF716_33595 [Anaerolineae bacterium]|nr:hypothetical protein [Anaerolineae bacterium]